MQSIAKAESALLSAIDVGQFKEIYTGHMQIEETKIAPMAMRIFSEAQMKKFGAAMQQRRGILSA